MCYTSILYINNTIILEIKPLFAINTFHFRLNLNHISELVKYIYQFKQNDQEGRQVSNELGWQSNDLVGNQAFNTLLPFLNKKISKTFESEYKIEEIWANISPRYAYNSLHTHSFVGMGNFPYDQLSGVIYLQCSKDSGDLILYNPHFPSVQSQYSPKVGDVILFPSTLPHSVDQNLSNSDRISLAFNCNIWK